MSWAQYACVSGLSILDCTFVFLYRLYITSLAAYPLVSEDWHFSNRGGLCPYKLNPATFYWIVCNKSGKWAVMNLCVQFFNYILELVFFIFHFIISTLIQYSQKWHILSQNIPSSACHLQQKSNWQMWLFIDTTVLSRQMDDPTHKPII